MSVVREYDIGPALTRLAPNTFVAMPPLSTHVAIPVEAPPTSTSTLVSPKYPLATALALIPFTELKRLSAWFRTRGVNGAVNLFSMITMSTPNGRVMDGRKVASAFTIRDAIGEPLVAPNRLTSIGLASTP